MTFNWITVAAQVFNFLLLVWLLKRFLYEPVRRTMAQREEEIAARFRQADERIAQARAEEARYRQMAAELEQQRERLLQEARVEAERERSRLLEEATQEALARRRALAERLEQEWEQMEMSLRENLVRQVCDISRDVLMGLAGVSLEEAMLQALERSLEEAYPAGAPDGVSRSGASSIGSGRRTVEIRTSFEPSRQQQERLVAAAARWLGAAGAAEIEAQFAVDPSLILGVEFLADHKSAGWSVRERIGRIEERALAAALAGFGGNPVAAREAPGEVGQSA